MRRRSETEIPRSIETLDRLTSIHPLLAQCGRGMPYRIDLFAECRGRAHGVHRAGVRHDYLQREGQETGLRAAGARVSAKEAVIGTASSQTAAVSGESEVETDRRAAARGGECREDGKVFTL
jgi:hypothetical protein